MMDILKLSFAEDMDVDCDETKHNCSNPYLERQGEETIVKQKPVLSKDEQAARIKEYFSQLVGDGMSPNEAAAKAINMVADLARATNEEESSIGLMKGELSSVGNYQTCCVENLNDVLSTAKKYVQNVQKQPFSPKFRSFKLSNKVSDRITSSEGGIECLVNELGFRTYSNDVDFMASIPLSIDISALILRINKLLGDNH